MKMHSEHLGIASNDTINIGIIPGLISNSKYSMQTLSKNNSRDKGTFNMSFKNPLLNNNLLLDDQNQ